MAAFVTLQQGARCHEPRSDIAHRWIARILAMKVSEERRVWSGSTGGSRPVAVGDNTDLTASKRPFTTAILSAAKRGAREWILPKERSVARKPNKDVR